jgi:hypothetical protein
VPIFTCAGRIIESFILYPDRTTSFTVREFNLLLMRGDYRSKETRRFLFHQIHHYDRKDKVATFYRIIPVRLRRKPAREKFLVNHLEELERHLRRKD